MVDSRCDGHHEMVVSGLGAAIKPRASNWAMTAARNSQVFLRSGLFNRISGRCCGGSSVPSAGAGLPGFLIAWWRRRQKIA
jgi:hypothetical protein